MLNTKDIYRDYLNSLIKESVHTIENDLLGLITQNDFLTKVRIMLLKEQRYNELASIYELIGMNYKSANKLFFNNYLTYNYQAHSLLNVSCYYYKYINSEYSNLLAQLIAFSQKKVLNQNVNIRLANEYAMNVELLGDIYLLLDNNKSKKYYSKAKVLYEDVDRYDQLSSGNEYWCADVLRETSIALKECFNIELNFSDLGIERIQQKSELFNIINQ
ncbi:hypothetical protein [Vallitalea guaymasensis]|uniref:Uncharacterized protein n=1 Tax=Vallitalea guaymasensis TaxID=1185412 RepID=A0A8J8MD90_9FIRM|nr:hypothetical protein [Vallitalea guaymasensis]QUH30786.1 hypothetical protein HYG85_18415 [Vallitalea guaymasensis]